MCDGSVSSFTGLTDCRICQVFLQVGEFQAWVVASDGKRQQISQTCALVITLYSSRRQCNQVGYEIDASLVKFRSVAMLSEYIHRLELPLAE
jgi:hypothetical protein